MADTFVDFVAAQLEAVEGLAWLAMFGGHGVYHGRTLVGIVSHGRLYLRADPAVAGEAARHGANPYRADHEVLRTFLEVPPDVLHDRGRLTQWARAAFRPGAARVPSAAPAAADRDYPFHSPFR